MLVRFTRGLYDRMVGHLRSEVTEQVGFLFMRKATDEFIVEDFHGVPKAGLVQPSEVHAEVSEEEQLSAFTAASRRGLWLGEVHSHPGSSHLAAFSASDLRGLSDFVPHVC